MLSLTATPVLAQDATSIAPIGPDPLAPVAQETVTPEPEPQIVAPLAIVPEEEAVVAEPVAPVQNEAAEPVAEAAPAAPKVSEPAKPAASPAPKSVVRAELAQATVTEDIAPLMLDSEAMEDIAAMESEALPGTPAPVVEEAAPAPSENKLAELLPFAGAALLGLIGMIVAMRLLRRRPEVKSAPVAVATQAERPVAPAHQPVHSAPQPLAATGIPTVEAAYAGPTPDNPSLSLKHRLKRASFFAQRQRSVEAGTASPLSRFAGLPQLAVEQARQLSSTLTRTPQPAF